MHIHKINPNLQEHQNFLAQNRKDPITGDSISEGDEVVFCASCKSVFLIDTWEYLGRQHCKQKKTLIELPLSKELCLSTEEDILFFAYLSNGKGSSIPNLPSEWNTVERKLSKFHNLFNGMHIYFISYLFFMGGVAITVINHNPILFIIGVAFAFITLFIPNWHNTKYGKKLNTIHKNFKNEVFFFSKKSIGFSRSYGIKEYTLNADYIESLEFNFSTSSNSCIINYKDGYRTKFYLSNLLKKYSKEFLEAVEKFNSLFSISIHLKIGENSHYQSAIDFVSSTESNITVTAK